MPGDVCLYMSRFDGYIHANPVCCSAYLEMNEYVYIPDNIEWIGHQNINPYIEWFVHQRARKGN
jgi:hypothetical protein